MIRKEVIVKSATGLHARPATTIVKKASAFKSDIQLEYNDKKANVKSLIGVLSLGVTKGSTVTIVASGDDETLAAEEMVKIIESLEE
jgi:phosphocarrier protein